MGRKSSVNLNLPPQMRARRRSAGTFYYYDTGERPRREIPLGKDYTLAVQQWSRLHQAKPTIALTIAWAIGKYLASPEYEAVSAGTQADYKFALDKLIDKFGDAPLDEVKPSHVVLYIEQRSKESRHRALRERAVLSMLYAWAIERDYATTNPAGAVKRKRLPGRKGITITDDMQEAVYAQADQPLKDAMDLAYLIGQRPADVLKLQETDIKGGILDLRQNKTGTPIRIQVAGELAALIERILARKRTYPVRALALLVDERGRPMTKAKLRGRFEKARTIAGIAGAEFQFRDLRRKSGGDLREQAGIEAAQTLLGHKSIVMTEHYTTRGKISSATPSRSRGNTGG